MTSPQTPPAPSDQSKNQVPAQQSLIIELAELRNEADQVVSRGEIRYDLGDKVFLFYPRDKAPQDTIRTRAKTLFLNDRGEVLTIFEPQICQAETPHELHFHIKPK